MPRSTPWTCTWSQLVATAAPELLAVKGVGTDIAGALLVAAGDNPDRLHSEAAFASLCGVAPIPASSGKTNRHRLSRGGDRDANRALYLLALGRMGWDPATRTYVTRRTAAGLSKPEIIRCLKRYLAREIYRILVKPPGFALAPSRWHDPSDLREGLLTSHRSIRLGRLGDDREDSWRSDVLSELGVSRKSFGIHRLSTHHGQRVFGRSRQPTIRRRWLATESHADRRPQGGLLARAPLFASHRH